MVTEGLVLSELMLAWRIY